MPLASHTCDGWPGALVETRASVPVLSIVTLLLVPGRVSSMGFAPGSPIVERVEMALGRAVLVGGEIDPARRFIDAGDRVEHPIAAWSAA